MWASREKERREVWHTVIVSSDTYCTRRVVKHVGGVLRLSVRRRLLFLLRRLVQSDNSEQCRCAQASASENVTNLYILWLMSNLDFCPLGLKIPKAWRLETLTQQRFTYYWLITDLWNVCWNHSLSFSISTQKKKIR